MFKLALNILFLFQKVTIAKLGFIMLQKVFHLNLNGLLFFCIFRRRIRVRLMFKASGL